MLNKDADKKGLAVNEFALPDFTSYPLALSPYRTETGPRPFNSSVWPNQDTIENAIVTMKRRYGEHADYVDYPFYSSPLVIKRLQQFRDIGRKSTFTMDDHWINSTWYRTDYPFARDA